MTIQYASPATHITAIKAALIKIGYATPNTPDTFIQDEYFKYIMVRQTGFNPLMPYSTGLLPKEIRDLLDTLPTYPTYKIVMMYVDEEGFMSSGGTPEINIYIDGVKVVVEDPILDGDIYLSYTLPDLEGIPHIDDLPQIDSEGRSLMDVFYIENRSITTHMAKFDMILQGSEDAVSLVVYQSSEQGMQVEFGLGGQVPTPFGFNVELPSTVAAMNVLLEDYMLGRTSDRLGEDGPWMTQESIQFTDLGNKPDGLKLWGIKPLDLNRLTLSNADVIERIEGLFWLPIAFKLAGFNTQMLKRVKDGTKALKATVTINGVDTVYDTWAELSEIIHLTEHPSPDTKYINLIIKEVIDSSLKTAIKIEYLDDNNQSIVVETGAYFQFDAAIEDLQSKVV